MLMRKVHILAVLLVVAASLLVGCGSSSPQPTLVKVCSGLTDQCHSAPIARLNRLAKLTHSTHCHVADVSDYQGVINWQRAKSAVCGGIAKAGEAGSFGGGGQFVANWQRLRAAGLWHSGYWFVRGTASCLTQASLIIQRLRAVGYATDRLAGPFMLDVEVRGANRGGTLAVCIDGYIFHEFHRHAEIYTASGTWPGGSHGALALWQAAYGSFLTPFWQPVNLWQCTDGVVGCVYYVPGIGFGDVSVNLGLIQQAAPPAPKPSGPYGIYPTTRFVLANGIRASERTTVRSWDRAHCKNPARRPVCKSSHGHLILLRERLLYVAHHPLVNGRPTWGRAYRGSRLKGISARLSH